MFGLNLAESGRVPDVLIRAVIRAASPNDNTAKLPPEVREALSSPPEGW